MSTLSRELDGLICDALDAVVASYGYASNAAEVVGKLREQAAALLTAGDKR